MPEVPAQLRSRLEEQIQSIPEPGEVARKRPAPPGARGRFIRRAAAVATAVAASVAVYLAVVPEREPRSEVAAIDEPVGSEESVVVDRAPELEAATDEELAVLLQLETIQDLDVIANLEMLERLMVVGEGSG